MRAVRQPSAHASRGAPLQVELSTLADPGVGRLLTARGYRLVGFENVLGRRLNDAPAASAAVRIDEIETGEARLWIETVADAFLHPDVFDGPPSHEAFDRARLERAYEDTAGVAGMSRLLARLDGVVAGGAAMYVRDGTALLCGAATLSHHHDSVGVVPKSPWVRSASSSGRATSRPGSSVFRSAVSAASVLVRMRETVHAVPASRAPPTSSRFALRAERRSIRPIAIPANR